MLPKKAVELRNDGMIVGNGSGLDLAESSFDLIAHSFRLSWVSPRQRAGHDAWLAVRGLPPLSGRIAVTN